jgi:FtsH-binding integral membrane protein
MFENNSEAYLGCQDTYTVRSAVSAILKNVYLWMTMALLISGFTAMLVAGNPVLIEKIFAGR